MDPTLKWNFAEITSINESEIRFKIIDKKNKNQEILLFKNIKWTLRQNKAIKDIHEIGDIIFVKKENNTWKIKQYQKVNGGIIALDPFNGNVLLVGGFNYKTSEFNRVTQAKRQPGSAFKPIVYAAALENGYTKHYNFRCSFC